MSKTDMLLAGAGDIKENRKNYKVGMYFSLVILLVVFVWIFLSQGRWMIFDSGIGSKASFDIWILTGIVTMMAAGMAFFLLGQMSKGFSRECDLLGGNIHLEERQLIMIWAVIIGFILGMGFWDIVTMVHLAINFGILNIWAIPVTFFDFGIIQLILPVWGLVIIAIVKMSAVIYLYALAIKNMRRGTVCELASLDPKAIID